MDDRPVPAVSAVELAGDVRSRNRELGELRTVERQRGRPARRPPGPVDLNLYVLHRLFVLGEGRDPARAGALLCPYCACANA
jgi:hypothetical protein